MSISQMILPIAGIMFFYFLAKKPDLIAIALFVTIIADINFSIPGLPLNLRAIMTLALLIRIMTSKEKKRIPPFMREGYAKLILLFLFYLLAISTVKGLFSAEMLKESILCFIAGYLAYYFFFQENSARIIKMSLIISGIVCLLDLAYTYKYVGGFPALRVYYLFTPAFGYFNHNFFGQICGMVFIYLLSDYLSSNDKASNKLNLYMMPLMFLGILLSTSRSALLCAALVAIGMILKGLFSAKKGKKAGTLILVVIGCLVLTLFIFQIIQDLFAINSEFFETITSRLIDEPMAMINRAMGNNYNINQLDSMDWRIEATNIAEDTFDKLPMDEKLFGIGLGGFGVRNYGNGYDAHNGILLMMIEFGIVGFLIYMMMILSMLYSAIKNKVPSGIVGLMVFMIFYITSHNKELISIPIYLLTGTLAAQLHYYKYGNEMEPDEEPEVQVA